MNSLAGCALRNKPVDHDAHVLPDMLFHRSGAAHRDRGLS
jgi:hypothetical protein